jgi:hypothetical protein
MGTRFNLILEDHQYRALTAESSRLSVSVAELIRRAVDKTYALDPQRKVPGVELSLAVWRAPDAAVVGRRPGVRLRR